MLVAAVQLEASQRLPDEARLDRLVLEIVRRVGAIDEMPPDLYLAVEAQATRLSCSWIGYQMQLEWDLNDGIWTAPDQAAGLFRSALETALESGVDVAANAYRSGAVACLLRDEPGALVYFERAVNEDSSIPIDGAMREAVLFQMCVLDTLKTFGYGGCRDDRRFACAAASAARAIHFGRGDLISGDLDKYEASALAATKSQVQGTAIGVVKSMLRSA
jgi:hypothetical protein